MRVRLLVAAAVLSVVPAFVRAQEVRVAAPAQELNARVPGRREGTIEFTLSGGATLLDKAFGSFLSTSTTRVLNPNPGSVMPGGQLRATINFSQHMGFAVGAGMANASGGLLINPYGALTWTFNLNQKVSPFFDFGAGLSRIAAYTGSILGDATHRLTSSYTAFMGLGVRAMLGSNVGIRIEGRMSYAQYSEYGRVLNGAGFAGLSLFVGGALVRDSDGDRVADRRDACPDTPAGAIVDVRGCALDSDRDGVYDGLDQCAGTPIGATVDTQGCALDSDRDGVYDGLDRCPATPGGVPVDANGCPVDSDGDGVPESLDRCPNTPADARPVDANGCPVDADRDDVPDYQDRCPNTPANGRPVYPATDVARAGCPVDTDADGVPDYLDRCSDTPPVTRVDGNGCPVRQDRDGDGVTDADDRCPNTPPNARVDAFGCPMVELVVAAPSAAVAYVVRNLTFRAFRAQMVVSPNAELDSVAAAMRALPDARWEIAGHTDNRGTPLGNRRLSQRRAEAVRRYLVASGVTSPVLTVVGYGALNPLASNGTAAGRAQNRRIEIKRLP